jgi:hypothetical protein
VLIRVLPFQILLAPLPRTREEKPRTGSTGSSPRMEGEGEPDVKGVMVVDRGLGIRES